MDANHPQHDPEKAKRYSNVIKDYWKKIDRAVGKIIDLFGDDGIVIVLSDHGFGPRTGTFYVNDWLRQHGFLKVRNRNVRRSLLVRLGRNIEKFYFLFGKTRLYRLLSTWIYKLCGRELIYRIIFRYLSFERMADTIDWTQTKAFSCPHSAHFGQIYINLSGRDPNGHVKPSEYEKVRTEIIEKLGELRDPITGKRFRMEIHKPDVIYSGPYVNQAPDIIFSINNSECEADTSLGHDSLFLQGSFDLRCSGTHNNKGIFLALGSDIREGTEVVDAKITDLAPTLLHLFGVPIPRDMDGRVLTEIFKEDSAPARREVIYSDPEKINEREMYKMSRKDETEIKERLKSLGYLS